MSSLAQVLTLGDGVATIKTINTIAPDGSGNFTIAAGNGIIITSGVNEITISSDSGLVLLETQTASSQTSLAFTSLITSAYSNYLVIVTNGKNPANTGTNQYLLCQISSDSGATYKSSGYVNTSSSGFVVGLLFDDILILNSNLTIFNANSGLNYVTASSFGSIYSPSDGVGEVSNFNAYNTPIVVNAIRFVMDNGSAFSGTFSLYGYSH